MPKINPVCYSIGINQNIKYSVDDMYLCENSGNPLPCTKFKIPIILYLYSTWSLKLYPAGGMGCLSLRSRSPLKLVFYLLPHKDVLINLKYVQKMQLVCKYCNINNTSLSQVILAFRRRALLLYNSARVEWRSVDSVRCDLTREWFSPIGCN